MNKTICHFLSIFFCIILVIGTIGCSNAKTLSSSTTSQSIPESSQSAQSETTTYAKEIVIFAAAGIKPALDQAAQIFEQKYGTRVTVNYGGGGEVLSNMILAKSGDIYIAPEQRFMNSAIKQGAIDPSTEVNSIAYMIPVIGVQKGNPENILSLSDLAKTGIKVVVGNTETTALGELSPQILQKAAVYEAVNANIVTNASQVSMIITMLKTGQVDAGIIWHYFGTTASNDVDIVWIPKEYVTGIGEVQAAVSTYSKKTETAQKFIEMLASEEGKEFFQNNGYIIDREEAGKYYTADQ